MTLFFGKKRRRRTAKKAKSVKKPPARLLKICKKYRVKATKKVGKRRVYKSIAVLKRLCLKKARALKKKLIKMAKRSKKTGKKSKRATTRTRRRRTRSRFGDESGCPEGDIKCIREWFKKKERSNFGDESGCPEGDIKCIREWFKKKERESNFGVCAPGYTYKVYPDGESRCAKFGAMRRLPMFGNRRGRYGFGSGGNPDLNAAMGYSFCSDGNQGVLGSNNTGLFPSQCGSPAGGNRSGGVVPASAFGKRRKRRACAMNMMEFGNRRMW
jgi:hypothetical protein